MESLNLFERRIRALEETKVYDYKSLLFFSDDDLSGDNKKYSVKFLSNGKRTAVFEAVFNADCNCYLKLNGIEMSPYKPVNAQNQMLYNAEAVDGENIFDIVFEQQKPTDIKVKISGYIDDLTDESAITVLKEKGIVCHYDGRLKRAVIYKYNGGLQKIYQEANLLSASVGKGNESTITLFTVSEIGALSAKTLDLAGDIVGVTAIEDGVKSVSGTVCQNVAACYYIKDNAVKLCKLTAPNLTITFTGIKNACKIASTPNFGGAVAVIGYDRAATLYVD